MDSFTVQETFNTSAEQLYSNWLDSNGHAAMTGGDAEIYDQTGEMFTAWDDYITGTNVELIPDRKIVQKWRTVEFDDSAEDSDLTIELEDLPDDRCRLTIIHSNLQPGDGEKYKQGWEDHYFVPMRDYFR